MKIRRLAVYCIFQLAALGMAGEVSHAAPLPTDARDIGSARTAIDAYLTPLVTALSGNDPAAMTKSRNEIVSAITAAPGQAPPSGVFLEAFSDAFIAQLEPLTKNANPGVRLNAAIVTTRVAERAANVKLVPLVVTLLNDQSDAVVLWAVKASKSLFPSVLSNSATAKASPLLPAFIAAASKYVTNGSIAQSAYESLAINDRGNNPIPAAQFAAALPAVVDCQLGLMEKRLELYQKSTAPAPMAEQPAILFLATDRIFVALPQPLQARAVGDLMNLIDAAQQRYQSAAGAEKTDLLDLMRRSGSGLQVIGGSLQSDPMVEAAKKIYTLNNVVQPADIEKRVDDLFSAVAKVPQLAGVNRAAKLPATAPATEPTTAPST